MLVYGADPLGILERMMADVALALKIKYGLGRDPNESTVKRWRERTEELIREGFSRERAGEEAARTIFPDYRTHVYASEADTIEMLLSEAGKK